MWVSCSFYFPETLSSLDDIENKIPLKVVLQQEAHMAQENAFPEGKHI